MLTPTNPASALAPAQAKTDKASATSTSDFKSFLKLLTAQLRNQDPLSPLDSTQFVEQLASFSAVEQQIETNRLLGDMASGAAGAGLETATLWIGKSVEAASSVVRFAGDPLAFTLPPGATGEIVVRDAANDIVYSAPAGGRRAFAWDGSTSAGPAALQGDYKVTLESRDENDKPVSAPLDAVARVMEARLVDGAVRLILDNGSIIDPAAIKAVHAPAAAG